MWNEMTHQVRRNREDMKMDLTNEAIVQAVLAQMQQNDRINGFKELTLIYYIIRNIKLN